MDKLREMLHIKEKDKKGEHHETTDVHTGRLSGSDYEGVRVHKVDDISRPQQQQPFQGQKHHEKSDLEKGGVGPDDEGVRVYEEDDKGSGVSEQQHKATAMHSSTHVKPVLPIRRPLHEEATGESVEKVKMVSTAKEEVEVPVVPNRRPLHEENTGESIEKVKVVAKKEVNATIEEPVGEKQTIETEVSRRPVHDSAGKAEKVAVQPQQPSPRSPREHLYEPEHIDEEKSEKGSGIKDKIMSGLNRMMGRSGKESDKDSVTEGREVRDESITDGTKTSTASEYLDMPSGTSTVHGSTPHSKITATVTETRAKKTITVTEHVQKKGMFGSSAGSNE